MNCNDMVDISVEVEALNLDGIKQNLLDYVEREAKIDINNSVEKADKSARDASAAAVDASAAAVNASASAELASDSARQASESLGHYYTKNETDNLLNAKQNILTFDNSPTNASTNPVTSGGVYTALSGKANTATTLAGYGITDGANTALNNLNSDGQMIVDSANETISNCILEIPQNIKCSLASGVLTLATGSILTHTGSTYSTYTTTADITRDISEDNLADGNYIVFASHATIHQPRSLSDIKSGTTFPTSNLTNLSVFFNTDDKKIYRYLTSSSEWTVLADYYPLCEITVSSGSVSFAKDTNGNDMIFNGACFIGHHIVVYPNVKYLLCNGFTNDKTLNSDTGTLDSLQIRELVNNRNVIALDNNLHLSAWKKVEKDKSLLTSGEMTYVASENLTYGNNGSSIAAFRRCFFVDYVYNATIVTDFTIRQPVRTATVEMLDKKQDAITSITGYNATKMQTLKNVSGTLTWVDD